MRRTLTRLALACCLLIPASALAQQTGSVSGGVFERAGNPVAGATVTIPGTAMPGARTTVTPENGVYRFDLLLPGQYKVDVEKNGVGRTSRTAEVSVARDTQADFLLGTLPTNPSFGAPTSYATQRRFQLSVLFDF